jgi:hypothetical protein
VDMEKMMAERGEHWESDEYSKPIKAPEGYKIDYENYRLVKETE